jgi:hypothetical protein
MNDTPVTPLAFLGAAERRKRRSSIKVEQLSLCTEPNHETELAIRRAFADKRGPRVPDAFRRGVQRQRHERERGDVPRSEA